MSQIIIIIIIGSLLSFINYILTYNSNIFNISSEGSKEYECGFQEFEDTRNKYYLKYYLIAIMFLIFDIETLFLYPLLKSFSLWTSFISLFLFFSFIVLLYAGLIYEKLKGLL